MCRCLRSVTVFFLAGSSLVAAPPLTAAAETGQAASPPAAAADDLSQLKHDLEALRRDYAERVAAIEARIAALETPPAPVPEAAPLPAATGSAAASSAKVFNPDMAAIGNFVGVTGPTPGSGEPSLSLQESELSFQAVVDPYARADFFLTFGPEEVGRRGGLHHVPDAPRGLPRARSARCARPSAG